MDLAEFIEERQATRKGLHTGTIEEDDVRDFMEMLLKDKGWSDAMEIPATADSRVCQHVFIARSRGKHGGRPMTQVCHGSQALTESSRRKSLPPTTKSDRIPQVLAASVANSVQDWQTVSNGQMTGFEARLPHVHDIVLTAVEEIMASHQANSSIGFLANIGPQRQGNSIECDFWSEPRSPAQWVFDKTSPIRTVVMWPVKVTKRSLLTSDAVGVQRNVSPVHEKRRVKSLSLLRWPIQGLAVPIGGAADVEREERRVHVHDQVQQLLNEQSPGRLFNFTNSLTRRHKGSDMADLKETRSNIEAMVAFISSSGLFEEAARCFAQP